MQNIPLSCAKSSAVAFNQENELFRTLYPDMGTELVSPDGTVLRFDASGRISSVGNRIDAMQKSFSYDAAGMLVEVWLHGYGLFLTETGWTDGLRELDIIVSVDNIGTITLIEQNPAAMTRLTSDGSAVTVYLSEQNQQLSIHHSFRPCSN